MNLGSSPGSGSLAVTRQASHQAQGARPRQGPPGIQFKVGFWLTNDERNTTVTTFKYVEGGPDHKTPEVAWNVAYLQWVDFRLVFGRVLTHPIYWGLWTGNPVTVITEWQGFRILLILDNRDIGKIWEESEFPSSKLTYGNHHFSKVNQLFLWTILNSYVTNDQRAYWFLASKNIEDVDVTWKVMSAWEVSACNTDLSSLQTTDGLLESNMGNHPSSRAKSPLVNKHSYWKLPFIVDLPIENGDFPWLC